MSGLACANGCRGNCRVSGMGAAEPTELERKSLWRTWWLAHANSRLKMQDANARAQAGDTTALEEVRTLTTLQAKLAECHPYIDEAIARARFAGQWFETWPQSAADLARAAYEDEPTLGVFPFALAAMAVLAIFAVAAVYLVLRQVASIANSIRAVLTSPTGGSIVGLALLAGIALVWSNRRRGRFA